MNLASTNDALIQEKQRDTITENIKEIQDNNDEIKFDMLDCFSEIVVIFNSHLMIKKLNGKAAQYLGKCVNWQYSKDCTVINDFIDTLKIIDKFRTNDQIYHEEIISLFTTNGKIIECNARLFKDPTNKDSDIIICLEELK